MFATIRRYESIDQSRTALPNPPKITTGEVVVHKTSELVQA